MTAQTQDKPTLWQIDISHYAEKARWALEYKGVDHGRRSLLPGSHIPIALVADPRRAADHAGAAARRPRDRRLDRDHRRAGGHATPSRRSTPSTPRERSPGDRAGGLVRREPRPARTPAALLRADPGARRCFAEIAAESRAGPAGQGEAGGRRLRPRLHQHPLGRQQRRGRRAAPARRSSPPSTSSRPSWSRATASSSSATASASPTSPPPRSSTRSSSRRRARSTRTCRAPPALDRFRESLSDRRGFKWVEETFRKHRRSG